MRFTIFKIIVHSLKILRIESNSTLEEFYRDRKMKCILLKMMVTLRIYYIMIDL